jgi:hypothetical protein
MRKYRIILALIIVAGVMIYSRMRSDQAPAADQPAAAETGVVRPDVTETAVTQIPEGYEQLLTSRDGRYSKSGWNHYGPGYFDLDPITGVLTSHGGMGLFWYSVKEFSDFVLELEFACSDAETNSGVFLRVPGVPTSDYYIYHSFEIQIYDAGEGIHMTGAAYDAEAPTHLASNPPGDWNHFKITFVGGDLQVELNGEEVMDWEAEPRGKVEDLAPRGYIGLQNHDDRSPVYFRNIYLRELE